MFPGHQPVEGKDETFFKFSECKFDTVNTCIREFRRQAHVNYGYEEPRREQVRLQEELAQREKPLRDTRIRNIREVEELK